MRISVMNAARFAVACGLVLGLFSAAAPSAPATAAPSTLKEAAQAKGRYFGGIMSTNSLANSTATSLAAREFGVITPENEMKWDTTEPSQGDFHYSRGDAIVDWAQSNGMRVRGHTLVWYNPDVESQLPAWVKQLPLDQVRAAMENHVTQQVSHYKGKLYAWDVVNEPFNDDGTYRNSVFYQAMGRDYIAIALRAAKAADPDVKLYLNDYSIEGDNTAKSNAMYDLVKWLKGQGVPLDGIGFESHFEVGKNPYGIQANMKRFSDLGVDVAVTEYDNRMRVTDPQTQNPVNPGDLNQQATDTANLISACLNTARCVGVSQWAVGDKDNWVPYFFQDQGAATLFDIGYQPKPAYYAALNAFGSSGGGGGSRQGSTSLGAYVWLIGAQSNKCLDRPANSGDGAQVQLWDCSGAANQAFLLAADGSVHVQDKCLDTPTGATAGAKAQVWGCSGAANQKWTLATDGTLRSNSSGLCAQALGDGTANATGIILKSCTATASQRWSFSNRPLINNPSGRCLDIPTGGGDGTQPQLWDCSGAANQSFKLDSNAALRVQDKCLDVPQGAGSGANAQIWGCSGAANQKWTLTASGAIVNPSSGLCLDALNQGTANTTEIILSSCTGASSQLWHM
ncbi:endo-1,4-beta-xylanase [Streptomyces xanthophaeus]|uniref:endo-1,4-beta-xylanase n=1 Tax=Streptomyces xanthophaeus TaxID=67385 RepID=UPI00398FDEBE